MLIKLLLLLVKMCNVYFVEQLDDVYDENVVDDDIAYYYDDENCCYLYEMIDHCHEHRYHHYHTSYSYSGAVTWWIDYHHIDLLMNNWLLKRPSLRQRDTVTRNKMIQKKKKNKKNRTNRIRNIDRKRINQIENG